jgi:hypothetical protein
MCFPPAGSSRREYDSAKYESRRKTSAADIEALPHSANIRLKEYSNALACRTGKGTHRAVKYAYEQCRNYPCFIKLDVRKYFDSVNHDILKSLLARIIKDGRCLLLLYGIIDSYCTVSASEKHAAKGLPIGNLTSQFFANLYLSPLDHYVLEELHASAYVRYMDDFVLWGSSRFSLCTQLRAIRTFCKERLSLTLKEPVVSSCAAGIPFLGCRITSDGIRLLQKTLRRKRRKIKLVTSLCAVLLTKAHCPCPSVFYSKTC